MLLSSCNYIINMLLGFASLPESDRTPNYIIDRVMADESTLTIILFDDKVYYYVGSDIEDGEITSMESPSLANAVVKMQKELGDKFQVEVKEFKSANPQNLDMLLRGFVQVGVLKYALVDPTDRETAFVATLE